MQPVLADITTLNVDCIVNAANSSLLGGGGVDGAIHRAGGSAILNECRGWVETNGLLAPGNAMITTGGNLKALYVIHTVGPIWKGGHSNEHEILANCYINSLKLAMKNGLQSIAFPNISTGVYGFPKKEAAEVAIKIVREFILQEKAEFRSVIFCCFDEESYEVYRKGLR